MINMLKSALGASYYSREETYRADAISDFGELRPPSEDVYALKWDEVINNLLSARNLEEDWDGQGAEAPTKGTVDTALQRALFMKQLGNPPPDEFGANVDGTITLGWHQVDRTIVIEIVSPTQEEAYTWTDGNQTAEQFLLAPTR